MSLPAHWGFDGEVPLPEPSVALDMLLGALLVFSIRPWHRH
jgi:hypothetical protein